MLLAVMSPMYLPSNTSNACAIQLIMYIIIKGDKCLHLKMLLAYKISTSESEYLELLSSIDS